MAFTPRRLAPLGAVIALLLVAGVAAALSSPEVTRVPLPVRSLPPELASPGASGSAATPGGRGALVPNHPVVLPAWVGTALTILGVALFIALAAVIAWFLLRGSVTVRKGRLGVDPGATPFRPRHEEIIAALDASLADLADESDPRRAVIACWVRLERAAADAGTPRRVGDAPGELVTRLLGTHQVSADLLTTLAALYRAARYGSHAIDDGMRVRAQSALTRLRGELTASAGRMGAAAGGPA